MIRFSEWEEGGGAVCPLINNNDKLTCVGAVAFYPLPSFFYVSWIGRLIKHWVHLRNICTIVFHLEVKIYRWYKTCLLQWTGSDATLSCVHKQINSFVSASFFHSKALAKLKPFLSVKDLETSAHTFISSCLSYCNYLSVGFRRPSLACSWSKCSNETPHWYQEDRSYFPCTGLSSLVASQVQYWF